MTTATSKEAVLFTLGQIPSGTVVTYGQLAALAGMPRAARLVGSVLRDLPSESRLPWHRVVNAQGRLSLPAGSPGYIEQLRRLMAEGVAVSNGKINLRVHRWHS